MKDYIREYLSYPAIAIRRVRAKKIVEPLLVKYGEDKEQYFLYYEPKQEAKAKIVFWIHGGGWNTGSPKAFDYVGQCLAKEGYRMVSFGYRLSPKHKYPKQIEDVCACYNRALDFLKEKGIDTSGIVVAGPSAGAHLSSLLCYSGTVQKEYHVDVRNVIGYIGSGGVYSFRSDQNKTVKYLEDMLFEEVYDRRDAEPVYQMTANHIPMLLIHSGHDGLIEYGCTTDFAEKASKVGNKCDVYDIEDKKDTHSWYTAGMFLDTRDKNKGLDRFFNWIEGLDENDI